MDIVVNEELRAYIDPLTPEEHEALERSVLAEGCRDALVLWGNVLVDGHNRYGICRTHGLPFRTIQNPRFTSLEDVQLWMIDQHLGRRSLSDFQRGVLALRKREIVAERRTRSWVQPDEPASRSADAPEPPPAALEAGAPKPVVASADESLNTREALAKAARLSSSQVQQIEKIHKQGAPELVTAVKTGQVSINAAAAVASLPVEEQVAAASAGADELRQAAKRVRESRRKQPEAQPQSLDTLRQRVAALEAENAALRRELELLRAPQPEAASLGVNGP